MNEVDLNEKKEGEVSIGIATGDTVNVGSAEQLENYDSSKNVVVSEDVWNHVFVDSGMKLGDMNGKQKLWTAFYMSMKLLVVLFALYVFIISLDLLGSAFQVLGGTQAGKVFRQSDVFNNPIAGLVVGILTTVLVQSSSTSTSIIISMTASGLLQIDQAVYMIMGCNIGTSVTNTIVSMGQIGDVNQFRRAFAGATVHDMFNFLSVLIMLPLEAATQVLEKISNVTVESMGSIEGADDLNFLKTVTKPVTNRIIRVNKDLIESIAAAQTEEEVDALSTQSMVSWKYCPDDSTWFVYCPQENSWSDVAVGSTLLLWALVQMMVCLYVLVKVLQSIFNGPLSKVLFKAINLSFPGRWDVLSGYVLILVGAVLTVLVQSSSITTSTLTPLVGLGALKLEKMFPVTLGANIGTTITGMLSALSSPDVTVGLILAFTHVYFNVFGIIIWYPIPFMRSIPLAMARGMGNITANHRWFAIFYIIVAFFLIPLALLGLSLAGWQVMVGVLVPVCLVIVFFVVVFQLREHKPEWLPSWLLSFDWMPEWMHTEPAWLQRYHSKMEARTAAKDAKRAVKEATEAKKKSLNEKILDRLGDGKNDQLYLGSDDEEVDTRTDMKPTEKISNADHVVVV
ncbi:hypothetical protein SARC_10621 [Sphaeroforma arctica JP610]|uniref:Sodium-dependent phosphate transport protein 2B n=1 Tax=Sphaeroforma arctica JP610 TaxID=667725 RepID=A0A0L0FJG1_9EUKA|nr:hypothetical protein SARC_10621 [Sphaeroforma arctica JP610]KNC76905.1 hypothetical protein SARC_10621 [Sphaeroforma arctica JP610]|eukprot:XP_014150807.1 hypothetical protein SARC_10621 [Sphaeroforma arctica JP610]